MLVNSNGTTFHRMIKALSPSCSAVSIAGRSFVLPDGIRSTAKLARIARSNAQSQEARNHDNHDHDADDIENVH
jgi:hypothetical protein